MKVLSNATNIESFIESFIQRHRHWKVLLNVLSNATNIESFIERFIQRHQHWKFYWKFHRTPPTLKVLSNATDIESIIESVIQRHRHWKFYWKFYPTPPTLKVLLKVLSNATDSSEEADEVDGRIGEDGQVLPQLEDADGDNR